MKTLQRQQKWFKYPCVLLGLIRCFKIGAGGERGEEGREDQNNNVIYCLFFIQSLYPEYALPTSLSAPRVVFLNENEVAPEKTFFLSVFLAMRKDLSNYHNWLMELLSLNQPPVAERYRTPEMIAYFRSVRRCQLCGVQFGSRKWSKHTQRWYIVRRQFDHDHILCNSANLRAITCRGKGGGSGV